MYLGKFNLNTLNKTKDIACLLYKLCRVGDIFGLYGDIGTGKTTFARYFINQGIKKNKVPSPSYNLYFKYECKKGSIYHLDAWRINDSLEVLNLGVLENLKESIFLIEWANKIENFLPDCMLSIKMECFENKRTISFFGNDSWKIRLRKKFVRDLVEDKIE